MENSQRIALVVEDHVDTADMLSHFMEMIGWRVVQAHSVEEALDATSAKNFNLILSDIGLPDGDGWELLPRLHARQPSAKAIAFTAYSDGIMRSYSAGFDAHLNKPFDLDELELVVHEVVH